MKRLGVIGGIAPATTVDYYQWLVSGWREQVGDGSYPRVVINCIDLSRLVALVTGGRLDDLTAWLVEEVERLAAAGAELALIAAKIVLAAPASHDQTYVHNAYMNELIPAVSRPVPRGCILRPIYGVESPVSRLSSLVP